MIQPRRSLLAVLAFSVILAACGGSDPVIPVIVPPPPPPPAPVVAGVLITGPTSLSTGATATLVGSARTSSGDVIAGKTIAWSTSDKTILDVGADGVAKAVAPGTASISATADGVSGRLTIIVTDALITTVTITPLPGTLYIGSSTQLALSAKDSASRAVPVRATTWSSNLPTIASVSSTGVVTGLAAGTATITALVEGVRGTLTVIVAPVPVASVTLAPYDSLLRFRFPKQLVAIAKDSAGNVLNRKFTYQSSDVDVALLDDNGLVTATGQGPVSITVSNGTKSAVARLFVPSDSGIYAAVRGGVVGDLVSASYDVPGFAGSGSATALVRSADSIARVTLTPPAGTYRVRAFTTADATRLPAAPAGYALLLGAATSVAVNGGRPSTVLVIDLKPYVATISAPTTTTVNSTVSVTWSFDDFAGQFSDVLPTGTLYVSSTAGADLSGTAVPATVTRDANGVVQFSASFAAPGSAGTLYFQVAATGATTNVLFPFVARGNALRTITVQ